MKMKKILICLSAAVFLATYSCKTVPPQDVKKPVDAIVTPVVVKENSPEVMEFTKAKEGFVTESLFQVVISSVLVDLEARKNEAKSVAEQKALNLLKTYAPPTLSEKGKKELREISKEGKLLDKNISIGGRYFFLYQIQKRDLKILVTTQLE